MTGVSFTAAIRSPRRRALATAVVVLALIVASVVAVFGVEAAGYPPCELCLKERVPFYLGMILAALTILATARGARRLAQVAFASITVLFLLSTVFGAYHAGVEWGFWPGPTDCTGTPPPAATSADFLHQLQTVHVVRCDAAALRILGVSLAGWNAAVSLAIAGLAAAGAVRLRRD